MKWTLHCNIDSRLENLLWETATVRWNDPDTRKCRDSRRLFLVTGSKSACISKLLCQSDNMFVLFFFFFYHCKYIEMSRQTRILSPLHPSWNNSKHLCASRLRRIKTQTQSRQPHFAFSLDKIPLMFLHFLLPVFCALGQKCPIFNLLIN